MNPQLLHLGQVSAGAGIGISVVGMGIWVGWIFSSAIQSVARQPEMAKQLTTLMYIGMALIEGMAFFGIVLCYLAIKG